jgi:hypothetical protein
MNTGTTGTTHHRAIGSGRQGAARRSPSTSPLGVGIRYTVMWLSVSVVIALLVMNALR